ncbi:unnamed protein product, partial [Meganyctiphanes norvegica]|uniref:C-type lectin domain-containing protein n=1 Tax=Meganyctiphanes norvegica TaxID=48144 RepID=A0AAV2S5C2_MEGNR
MTVIILSTLLAVGAWASQQTVEVHLDNSDISDERGSTVWTDNHLVRHEEHLKSEIFDGSNSECEYPFEEVGNGCYFLSDIKLSFEDAQTYCNNLTHGNTHEVTLAMLDYSREEDQALLDAVTAKEISYWIGGKTEDGTHWTWLDERDINIQAPFWYWNEPNEADNQCVVAHVSTESDQRKRSYLYDNNCDDSMNFICQEGNINCPIGFRRIGNHCYFSLYYLLNLSWQGARDYCQSLSVHEGYHADLAVLGLPDQEDYHLMFNLVGGFPYISIWMGAFAETDCDYRWVDGRTLENSSIFWFFNNPGCGSQDCVYLGHDMGNNRTYLADTIGSDALPFVCQMFKNN